MNSYHQETKQLHQRNERLHQVIEDLHQKLRTLELELRDNTDDDLKDRAAPPSHNQETQKGRFIIKKSLETPELVQLKKFFVSPKRRQTNISNIEKLVNKYLQKLNMHEVSLSLQNNEIGAIEILNLIYKRNLFISLEEIKFLKEIIQSSNYLKIDKNTNTLTIERISKENILTLLLVMESKLLGELKIDDDKEERLLYIPLEISSFIVDFIHNFFLLLLFPAFIFLIESPFYKRKEKTKDESYLFEA